MKFNSLRFKISILYTAILGIILLVYSGILYFNLLHILYHNIDLGLENKAKEIENIINSYSQILENGQEDTPYSLKRAMHIEDFEEDDLSQRPEIKKLDEAWRNKIEKLDLNDDYIVIFEPSGKIAERSNNISEPALALLKNILKKERILLEGDIFKNSITKDLQLRIIARPFFQNEEIKYIIAVATSIRPTLLILKSRLIFIIFTVPLILLFTSFLGRFFVIRIFRPITEITQTAKTISHRDMTKRVEKSLTDEEIESLVNAFNDMILRLEKSFNYVAELSSQIAHELKTPLAIIRGESEIALRKERSPEEYKRAIEINLGETQRMLKTIEDLLLLTRLDFQPEVFKFEQLDLVEFFKDIYQRSKVLSAQKDIKVFLNIPQRPININADRLHLRRLFFNLIDNAIKFTPKNGRIDMSINLEDKKATVSISDTGIGIAEEDLPKIFDRFFHIDRSGQGAMSGSGLGLSIALSITKIHQGDIEARSQLKKGSTFIVSLPTI